MSGSVGHRKRLISITAANLRANHIYISGHLDFFPSDSIGQASSADGLGTLLRLDVEGLPDPVFTDIPRDSKTGKPRRFFRKRAWVRDFFQRHQIKPGDTIAIERIASHHFRIVPFESKANRFTIATSNFILPPEGDGPTVIELFAGCGGMAYGFKLAGFRTVLANEWDEAACATLRANVTDRVVCCAIQEIDEFPKADVVAGGPPCQGFSNLGERVPNDPRNELWRHFLRCVESAQPRFFVLENVPPLLKSDQYREFLRSAGKLGYRVEGRILNAADYGVPQTRRRAIVIGAYARSPVFPEPTHFDPAKGPAIPGLKLPWRTVRDAIGHLPAEPDGCNWHVGRNPTAKSLERYRCIPPGGNRWDLPSHLMPACWKKKTEGGTDLFGRLWWDRPSVTIRTEFYKPEKGRYLHPEAHRPITHREAALLQSFPEDYEFIGSKIEVGVQIGNAVPPLLAFAIASQLRVLLEQAELQCANRSD